MHFIFSSLEFPPIGSPHPIISHQNWLTRLLTHLPDSILFHAYLSHSLVFSLLFLNDCLSLLEILSYLYFVCRLTFLVLAAIMKDAALPWFGVISCCATPFCSQTLVLLFIFMSSSALGPSWYRISVHDASSPLSNDYYFSGYMFKCYFLQWELSIPPWGPLCFTTMCWSTQLVPPPY